MEKPPWNKLGMVEKKKEVSGINTYSIVPGGTGGMNR